jgi:hypothetical protein
MLLYWLPGGWVSSITSPPTRPKIVRGELGDQTSSNKQNFGDWNKGGGLEFHFISCWADHGKLLLYYFNYSRIVFLGQTGNFAGSV